ncbi:MAG: DNA repair protein RadA [Pseudomonadota bacterium]
MAKAKTYYVCESCGANTPKWQGQCPSCGAWNTLTEQQRPATSGPAREVGVGYAGEAPQLLKEVTDEAEARRPSGLDELDRVLGGGVVAGSVVLIGGDPGIGKSTLLLQASASLNANASVIYVTGEESLRQVSLRARRLGLAAEELGLLAETAVERILATAREHRPSVLVVDSIQTMHSEALQSAPGAVAQLRETTAALVRFAKQTGTAVFLVGHVTKEGHIAGPRVLEHMVDTVLYFESDAGSRYRIVRAVKNRFGAANEIGVFAMTEQGLRQVRNPSAIFLSRHAEPVAGSAVFVTREGSRPLLGEVQALVDSASHGNPRRLAVGFDQQRLAMLLAVMHRHAGVVCHDQDVFVNIVGGLRVAETAADLAAVAAVLSSLRDQALPTGTVLLGELGLAGEIRPVPFGEERLVAAAKHGFTRAIVPTDNAPRGKAGAIEGLKVAPAGRLEEALDALF